MATKGSSFQFISVQGPDAVKDRKAKRLARSHAVKQALEKKRKLQQQSGHNFCVTSVKENQRKLAIKKSRAQCRTSSSPALSAGMLDPFQMLAADSSRLQAWLSHHKTKQVADPVFSIADELVLQNFRSLFQTGLDDPALLNATMLTYAFAVTGAIDREFLGYHSQALNSIRVRMSSPEKAASESTLGAILLIAGIEARLSMPLQVQLHMNAIQHLLKICQAQGVYLTDGIKRAIFWQDLNSSTMTGSSRIVDHTTFAELLWRRDPFTPNAFILPPGFQQRSHLLTEEFVEVLKDIHALQRIRDTAHFGTHDALSMAQIDNHQASIQSRLASFQSHCSFLSCCHLAAYLCSATIRCKIWRDSVIPSYLSSQLLRELQRVNKDPVWDNHPDVMVWLLYIGGSFSPTESIRAEYIELLRFNQNSRFEGMDGSWQDLLELLKRFIWSDKAFMSPVKMFWEEVSS